MRIPVKLKFIGVESNQVNKEFGSDDFSLNVKIDAKQQNANTEVSIDPSILDVIRYDSSDPSVATIDDKSGLVKLHKNGITKITAKQKRPEGQSINGGAAKYLIDTQTITLNVIPQMVTLIVPTQPIMVTFDASKSTSESISSLSTQSFAQSFSVNNFGVKIYSTNKVPRFNLTSDDLVYTSNSKAVEIVNRMVYIKDVDQAASVTVSLKPDLISSGNYQNTSKVISIQITAVNKPKINIPKSKIPKIKSEALPNPKDAEDPKIQDETVDTKDSQDTKDLKPEAEQIPIKLVRKSHLSEKIATEFRENLVLQAPTAADFELQDLNGKVLSVLEVEDLEFKVDNQNIISLVGNDIRVSNVGHTKINFQFTNTFFNKHKNLYRDHKIYIYNIHILQGNTILAFKDPARTELVVNDNDNEYGDITNKVRDLLIVENLQDNICFKVKDLSSDSPVNATADNAVYTTGSYGTAIVSAKLCEFNGGKPSNYTSNSVEIKVTVKPEHKITYITKLYDSSRIVIDKPSSTSGKPITLKSKSNKDTSLTFHEFNHTFFASTQAQDNNASDFIGKHTFYMLDGTKVIEEIIIEMIPGIVIYDYRPDFSGLHEKLKSRQRFILPPFRPLHYGFIVGSKFICESLTKDIIDFYNISNNTCGGQSVSAGTGQIKVTVTNEFNLFEDFIFTMPVVVPELVSSPKAQ